MQPIGQHPRQCRVCLRCVYTMSALAGRLLLIMLFGARTQTITMTIKQKNNLDTNLWHEAEAESETCESVLGACACVCARGRSPNGKWIDHGFAARQQRQRCTFVQIEATDLFDWNRSADLLSSRADATGPCRRCGPNKWSPGFHK